MEGTDLTNDKLQRFHYAYGTEYKIYTFMLPLMKKTVRQKSFNVFNTKLNNDLQVHLKNINHIRKCRK